MRGSLLESLKARSAAMTELMDFLFAPGVSYGDQPLLVWSDCSAKHSPQRGSFVFRPALVAVQAPTCTLTPSAGCCWPRDRHDKNLRDVKGLDFYEMSKDLTDNTVFWSYTEWDRTMHLMDHCK